jgi:hypothetical protein
METLDKAKSLQLFEEFWVEPQVKFEETVSSKKKCTKIFKKLQESLIAKGCINKKLKGCPKLKL